MNILMKIKSLLKARHRFILKLFKILIVIVCFISVFDHCARQIENHKLNIGEDIKFYPVVVQFDNYGRFICDYVDVKNIKKQKGVSFIPDIKKESCKVPDIDSQKNIEQLLFSDKKIKFYDGNYNVWSTKKGVKIRLRAFTSDDGYIVTEYLVNRSSIIPGKNGYVFGPGMCMYSFFWAVVSVVVVSILMFIISFVVKVFAKRTKHNE